MLCCNFCNLYSYKHTSACISDCVFRGLIKTQNSYLVMYPIIHSCPLWPHDQPSTLSSPLPSVRLTACLYFLIRYHLHITWSCSGDGLCVSVSISRPFDLRGAVWEVSVSAYVNGMVGTAQSDVITAGVFGAVSGEAEALNNGRVGTSRQVAALECT